MSRLAGALDGVIGVDTHRDTLAAAVTDPLGGLIAETSESAGAAGYQRLAFVQARMPGRRCWAVEGAGSYGAGLAAFLQGREERVVEVGRPKRPLRRSGGKSDALDAVRAAREAIAHDHLVAPTVAAIGRRCGCCWHPAQRLRRQGERHQPAQGAGRRGAQGAARRAPGAGHQTPGRALRQPAGPAGPGRWSTA